MISPTSTADELSGIGSYVFRTVPSISFDAETLSRYVIKTAHLNKVGICADFQDKASQSFSAQFTKHMQANGGRVVPTHCDFSSANFDPSTAVSSAVSAGADSLLLAPSVNKLQKAIDIARANQDKLSLFSYSVMYTIQTLYSGQAAVKGMVLTVPWYPLTSEPFVQKAKTLWGGSVSWRTAMAYDATQAIITGLRQSNTRNGLQQVLHSPNFLAQSATASTTVKFLPSGDSDGTAILVQVQPGNNSGTGYDFVLSP